MILRVVLGDGRDVRVALVRHKHHTRLQTMSLVRLALGDDHERAGHQCLARALVARHVEDRARLDRESRRGPRAARRALKVVRGDAAIRCGYPASVPRRGPRAAL